MDDSKELELRTAADKLREQIICLRMELIIEKAKHLDTINALKNTLQALKEADEEIQVLLTFVRPSVLRRVRIQKAEAWGQGSHLRPPAKTQSEE